MTVATTNTESKPTYIGLWTKTDKNGKPFWSGSDSKEVPDPKAYFVFGTDDSDVKVLNSVPSNSNRSAEFTKMGTFNKVETTDKATGEIVHYYKCDNMCIFKNTRREKDTHPHFNLVIYNT